MNETKQMNNNLHMLIYLTKEELACVNLMKMGAEITGKDVAEKSIDTFIHWCLQSKTINN